MENKRVRRVMFIGRSGVGKTTLCQKIKCEDIRYSKTQTINIRGGRMIDTPGEYLENRKLRSALMVASAEADVIALVLDATESGTMFPQAYSSAFIKPVIGIITKCDLAEEEAIERARGKLLFAGAGLVFQTSCVTGEGIDALAEYLNC